MGCVFVTIFENNTDAFVPPLILSLRFNYELSKPRHYRAVRKLNDTIR